MRRMGGDALEAARASCLKCGALTCEHVKSCTVVLARFRATHPLPVLCCSRPAGSLTRTAEVIEQRGVLRGALPTGFSRFGSGPFPPPLPPHLEVDGSSDAGSVSGISGGAGQVGVAHRLSQARRAYAQHCPNRSPAPLSSDIAPRLSPSCLSEVAAHVSAATLPAGRRRSSRAGAEHNLLAGSIRPSAAAQRRRRTDCAAVSAQQPHVQGCRWPAGCGCPSPASPCASAEHLHCFVNKPQC